MKDGMTLLRETCAAYGLEDVADDLWAWFSEPKSPTFNDVEATIQRLRTHPSYTAPSPWELLPSDMR